MTFQLLFLLLVAVAFHPLVQGAVPAFADTTDTTTVSEDAAVGTTVATNNAKTGITGVPTAVTILDTSTPDGGEAFFAVALKATSDDIILTTAKPLDREETAQYVLNIRASNSDGADDIAVTVDVADVNDNTTVFTPDFVCLEMNLGTAGGTSLVTYTAIDADSATNGLHAAPYALAEASTVYEMDATTGVVKVRSGQTLDTTSKGATLMLTAKDKGTNTGTAELKICLYDGCCSGVALITGSFAAIVLSVFILFL